MGTVAHSKLLSLVEDLLRIPENIALKWRYFGFKRTLIVSGSYRQENPKKSRNGRIIGKNRK